MTRGPWAPAQQPLPAWRPPTVPGSFSHLGTLPRSLLMGWATPGLGSRGPTGPSSVGSDSRDAKSGAGSGVGVVAALDMHLGTGGQDPEEAVQQWPCPSVDTYLGMGGQGVRQGTAEEGLSPMGTHLATSTSAADGDTVCSSSLGSR